MYRPSRRLVFAVCIVIVAIGAVATAPAVAVDEPTDGEFIVDVQADGDAEIALQTAYNLSVDDERAVFEELRDDEEARNEAAQQVREDTQFVSNVADDATERDIRVGEVTVETDSDGDVGVVTYRFTWENLAAVGDGRMVLAEPFSIYDELDRDLVVVAPEGFEITSVTPDPDERNETQVSWEPFTSLEGFEVVAEGETETDADGSGFVPAVAVATLLVVALLARRRY